MVVEPSFSSSACPSVPVLGRVPSTRTVGAGEGWADANSAGSSPRSSPRRKRGSECLLRNKNLARLDDDSHGIARFEAELLRRPPGDGGNELVSANVDGHLGHQPIRLDGLHRPLELV